MMSLYIIQVGRKSIIEFEKQTRVERKIIFDDISKNKAPTPAARSSTLIKLKNYI